jgi:hypothetical protein
MQSETEVSLVFAGQTATASRVADNSGSEPVYINAIPNNNILSIPVVNNTWTTNNTTTHPLNVEGSIYAAISGPQGTGTPIERGVNGYLATGAAGISGWAPIAMACSP